ncbi:MAG: thiamine pyrophosphate-binding protein [Pseudomonadota bacterium]
MTADDMPPVVSLPEGQRHGGKVLADQLSVLGVDTLFCVPGESFLGLLDGLYDHRNHVRVVTCRHEAGAANMADAYAKMTGKPGVCAVTRGPGATNASNGVHTAFQDSSPMILLVGQVSRNVMDREAFQEMDYRRVFGEMAKWVAQIEDAARIPEYLSRAFHVAQSGRPGPVVLALPEDILSEVTQVQDCRPIDPPRSAPAPDQIERLLSALDAATSPFMVVGGPRWSTRCCDLALKVAERFDLPVATSFRCQDYVDNGHPNYAGVIGIAARPGLLKAVREETDFLLAVGPRFGEMTTQGYSLIDIPNPQMTLAHVHPGADDLGHVYAPEISIAADPELFLTALLDASDGHHSAPRAGRRSKLNAAFAAFRQPTEVPGALNMGEVIRHTSDTLPDDTIYTNGAGNYSVWLHRFHAHLAYRTQLAPTSGSMGYGVPAAVAGKLVAPTRTVVCVAGDGCFLMTAQEMATARRYDLPIIYLVVNNGMYGTIRMHQERTHPGRVVATDLTNPDFVTYANAFGIPGELVDRTEDYPDALARAQQSPTGYLIELRVDQEALTPSQSLSAARRQGEIKRDNR